MPRRGSLALALAALVGPFALSFFSGGYFDEPRAWAGAACWGLLGLTYLARPGPASARHPRARFSAERPRAIAIAGLAGLAAWTAASMVWAPIAGSAYHYTQLAVLYLGAVLLAMRPFGNGRVVLVEPALALGALVVVAYGLSERLLPGVFHFARSLSAEGRLEQPLTYWNAMGELAAIGLVLCSRLAGDLRRPDWLRGAAAAASLPLGVGLYLSFSRGALFAAAVGLVSVIVLARTVIQLRVIVILAAGTVVAALVTGSSRAVSGLAGSSATREREGALVLVALAILAGAVVVGVVASRRGDPDRPLRLPPHAGMITLLLVVAGLGLAIVAGAKEGSGRPLSGGTSRLATLQSNRYAYWSVALSAFATEPLRGVGAGGWAVRWLRHRHINEGAQDAHSLPLQTLAELGLLGAVLLGCFLGGVAWAGRRAWLIDPAAAAGPLAGWLVWLVHQPLDWDWEMPTLTLIACALAGTLLGPLSARSATR